MYALVDCNNFYASCERVFNPNLEGRPVAILSNNDGCVISMSDEAKAIKLPFGAPIFKWESFCKTNDISVLSSNYPLYGDMSHRVMRILEQFSPEVEVYSIDEAFLKFEGFENYDLKDYGLKIRKRILKWTGIPTCVGIAPTKALSKVANKIARKFPDETKGSYVIDSDKSRIKALKWMDIGDVWGIGRGLKKRLEAKGCKTAYDFTQLDDNWVRKTLSIVVWRLKKDLEGISKIEMEEPARKKAIATTRSFDYTYDDINYIKERISTFATICSEKLRVQKSSCHSIVVMLRSDKHKEGAEQHRGSIMVSFPYPTDSSLLISQQAVKAVERLYKKGIRYKKAGVMVTGLVPTDNYQLDLFSSEDPKHKPLMSAIDALNKKYKNHKIRLGNQDLKRTWKMRQERLSPRYTTNIKDILIVK
ncbi:SOS mutagenesis and repair protein UmuC [Winogradskyella sp. PC-19]|uniref:Y-family DNA polymerase n=1 Tax=unclassified Winogradskyella TaxID=2615021 RepID=UPI000B3D1B4C|nr:MULTISPECIES: Y-family DNA polymerase [unclassified Winogradskyella]ARV09532.1 SOS mutagenesis and repair protein UmuC [Winogradskyella sp. PC-19]RZN83726.1 MAG: Y-family DNA polymerase [Winogradskyella sp.]